MRNSRALYLSAASAALAAMTAQAHAQFGAAQRGLDTIVVTAQKTEESLQDAAIPINAATGEELRQVGVLDASSLNKVAPALYVTNTGGANVGYFVRGVGNFANNGFTNPAIAFNIDGVYIGRPSSTIASFLDLDRVEVLKGPQGTLYGRNSTGGAINVIPNKPVLGETSGGLSVGYGNYDAVEATGYGNISLSDNVAARFAGTYTKHDGYFDDGTSSAEEIALRGQVYIEVNDSINARVSGDYAKSQGTGPGLHIDGIYGFAPFNPGFEVPNRVFLALNAPDFSGLHIPSTLEFIADNATTAPGFQPVEGFIYPGRNDTYWGVNAEVNFDLGFADLVVIPAYRFSELDNQLNGPPFKAAIVQDEAEQFSLEARLSGDIGKLDWILGGYYFDETVKGVNTFNQFAVGNNNDFDSTTESLAFFARGTFNVTDKFRIVGGIRYTDESRTFSNIGQSFTIVCLDEPPAGPPSCPDIPSMPAELTLAEQLAAFPAGSLAVPAQAILAQVAANPPGAPVVSPLGPFDIIMTPGGPVAVPGALFIVTPNDLIGLEDGDEEITYRAALEYDLTDDNLVYASFENGFRAGGFNTAFGLESYAPEFIDAYTIGAKNRFFNNTLEINIEGFYWEYKDQQLAALTVDGRGNNSFATRNVGESSVKGVEVDFQLAATESTLIRGGVQYLDATYDNFQFNQVDLSDDTDPPNFLTPVTGCDFAQVINPAPPPGTPSRSFDIDCSGKDALYSPDWTVSLGLNQTLDLGQFTLTGTFDARYRSERVIGFQYLPTQYEDGVITADASLTLMPKSGVWRVTGYMRNMTNAFVRSIAQVGSGDIAAASVEPPRTYGVRISADF